MNDRLFEPAEPDDGLKPWQRRDIPKMVEESRERTANAIARVDRHAPKGWKDHADDAIRFVAAGQKLLTADDIWWRLEDRDIPPPHEPRALGARLQAAKRAGLIVNLQEPVMSKRPETHGSWVAQWASQVYVQGKQVEQDRGKEEG